MEDTTAPRPPAPSAWRITGPDLVLAWAVLAASLSLYLATSQARTTSEGCWMVAAVPPSSGRPMLHALYVPACKLLSALFGGLDRFQTTRLLSAASAAIGCAGTFLVCRGLGLSRTRSLFGCALAAATPAVWFFATTVEFHALHFGMVSLAAALVLMAPWRRRGAALALSAVGIALGYASHQMFVLLLPGWVLLIAFAAGRGGAPVKRTWLAFVVVPVLLGGLLASILAVQLLRGETASPSISRELGVLSVYAGLRPIPMAWYGWLKPLALVAPLAAAAAFLRGRRYPVAALVLLCGVPWFFLIFVYPVPERGGFFLGSMPFLAALCASLPLPGRSRRIRTGAVLAALLAQAVAGFLTVSSYDRAYDPRRRVELVRTVLGERGVLVSADQLAPRISLYLPEVQEFSIVPFLNRALGADTPPEEFARGLVDHIVLQQGSRPVVIDQSYRHGVRRTDFLLESAPERNRPYMERFERALSETFVTRSYPDPDWPLLAIEGPR